MINHLHEEALPVSLRETEQPEREKFTDMIQTILAGLALFVFSPLLLVVSLAVKLTSPGPILYRGARIGKDGKIFIINKFRTLQVGAETRIGARLLNEQDACYTPLGRFLKRTKLDELPQLWNVVKGEMRLVGPRPVRPIFLEQFTAKIPAYRERFRMKPGMTGLAQLRGGYFTPPRNKLRYELLYLRSHSLVLDFKILLFTAIKICHRWLSLSFLLLLLFLFVSFIPAPLLSAFYFSLWGVRFNVVHGLIIIFGVWLLGHQLPQHRLTLYRTPLYAPMSLFLFSSLVAVAFSVDSAQALRGAAYYLVTGFFIALGIVNSNLTRKFVRQAISVVAATAVVISAIGLLKLLLIDYFTSAEASLQTGMAFLNQSPGITATLGSSAELAAYLALAVPYLLYRLTQAREREERDRWVAGATITFIGIILTKTPVGLCTLALTIALYMGRYFRLRTLAVCTAVITPFLFLSVHYNRLSVENIFTLRAQGWQDLFTQTSLSHLLFGYGARTLQDNWPAMQATSAFATPPSSAYLALLLENGVVGTAAMLWIVVGSLLTIYRAHQQATDEEIRRLLWAAFCSILGFLVSLIGCNAFANLTLQILFWGTLGMSLGVVTHFSRRRKEFLIDLKLGH